MKFIFAFLIVLHFHQLHVQCSDSGVIHAIINRLKELNGHSKINSTLTEYHVPSEKMKNHSECCVAKIKTLMMEALSNVIVPKEYQDHIEEIADCLEVLHPPAEVSERCRVEEVCTTNAMNTMVNGQPFDQHINYLRKLIRQKRSANIKMQL